MLPLVNVPLYSEVAEIPRFVLADAAFFAPVPPYPTASALVSEMDVHELRSYACLTAEGVAASEVLLEETLEDSLAIPYEEVVA